MTYDYPINEYLYVKKENTSYNCLLEKAEYDSVVSLCGRVFRRNFTNEICVRLDNCFEDNRKTIIELSRVPFYDFLVSNYLKFNYNRIFENADIEERKILEKFKQNLHFEVLKTFKNIISEKRLSNILAISLLIRDENGKYLLVRRNNNVGIANNFYSTTVTGSVDDIDYRQTDPILNCAKREMKEELNYELDIDKMKFKKIVIGQNKMQPVALIDGFVNNVDNIIKNISDSFSEENSKYLICNIDMIKLLLVKERKKMTEACVTHLEGVFLYE